MSKQPTSIAEMKKESDGKFQAVNQKLTNLEKKLSTLQATGILSNDVGKNLNNDKMLQKLESKITSLQSTVSKLQSTNKKKERDNRIQNAIMIASNMLPEEQIQIYYPKNKDSAGEELVIPDYHCISGNGYTSLIKDILFTLMQGQIYDIHDYTTTRPHRYIDEYERDKLKQKFRDQLEAQIHSFTGIVPEINIDKYRRWCISYDKHDFKKQNE